jgi:hypothetical protein
MQTPSWSVPRCEDSQSSPPRSITKPEARRFKATAVCPLTDVNMVLLQVTLLQEILPTSTRTFQPLTCYDVVHALGLDGWYLSTVEW